MTTIPEIQEVMTPLPCTAATHQSLVEADSLMKSRGIRHLPVLKQGRIVGIISDRDLKVAMQFPVPADTILEHVMVREPYIVKPDTPLDEVVLTMARQKYGSAIIQDATGKLVGIFTAIDALRVLAEALQRPQARAS